MGGTSKTERAITPRQIEGFFNARLQKDFVLLTPAGGFPQQVYLSISPSYHKCC
jgi:hypothetical protein